MSSARDSSSQFFEGNEQKEMQALKSWRSSISSSKRSFINNFNRESTFIEQTQKEQYFTGIRKALGIKLNTLVDNFKEEEESQQIEDAILELHRTTKKTHGSVPAKQRFKIE